MRIRTHSLDSGKAAFEVVDQACAAEVGGGEDDKIEFIRHG
jgi:hypothetical protein